MSINDKYEAELQRGLMLCGGNWETLARYLFNSHQAVQAEHESDRRRLKRLGRGAKSILIRGKTLHEIWMMQDEIDKYRKPRDTMKEALARLKTTLPHQHDRDEWEKILATYNSRLRQTRNTEIAAEKIVD